MDVSLWTVAQRQLEANLRLCLHGAVGEQGGRCIAVFSQRGQTGGMAHCPSLRLILGRGLDEGQRASLRAYLALPEFGLAARWDGTEEVVVTTVVRLCASCRGGAYKILHIA